MSEQIHIRLEGRAGLITLTRPGALNALTDSMVREIERALDEWQSNDKVHLVVVEGAGEKAFCAGGDVAEIYRRAGAGDLGYGRKFWKDEYRMNALIGTFSKPYVAIMDGITMGGGVGIAGHGTHRVVTERSVVAMPETNIGLIPDVGGTFLLSRAPGFCGEYLALTSSRMNANDAIYAGFADHLVPSSALGQLAAVLCVTGNPGKIADFIAAPGVSELRHNRSEIDAAFSAPDPVTCVRRLEATGTDFSRRAAESIRRNSPLAVWSAMYAVRQARSLASLQDCLKLEYRFTFRAQEESDFLEGVRAALIDKDRSPKWQPSRMEDVEPAASLALLAPLGADELSLEG